MQRAQAAQCPQCNRQLVITPERALVSSIRNKKTRNYAENRFTSFTACGGTGFGETAAAKWNAAVSTIQPAWLKTLFLPRKRATETTTLKSFEHHRH